MVRRVGALICPRSRRCGHVSPFRDVRFHEPLEYQGDSPLTGSKAYNLVFFWLKMIDEFWRGLARGYQASRVDAPTSCLAAKHNNSLTRGRRHNVTCSCSTNSGDTGGALSDRDGLAQSNTATSMFMAAAGLWLAAPVFANNFPDKPIRFIVPFAVGGASDILARTFGQKLTQSWGYQVVVDNRSGAGGNIGMELAAKAPPDGYTLLLGSIGTLALNPSLYRKLPYDPVEEFAPVTQLVSQPSLVLMNPTVPAKSIKELIALAQAKPGFLNYASAGIGTPPHLNAELFKSMARVDIVHVPYKAGIGGQLLTDLLGGPVQLYFVNMIAGAPHARSGRLRALGVTSTRRSVAFPEVPTLAESGVPGYEAISWYGVLVPARTPKEVIGKLHSELVRILHSQEIKERLAIEGAEPVGSAPAQFGALIKSEITKWANVIKDAGIRPD